MSVCFDLPREIIVDAKSGAEPRDWVGREQRRDRHGIEFIAKTNKRVSALSCFRLIDQFWERKWNTVQVRLVSIEKEFLLQGCD